MRLKPGSDLLQSLSEIVEKEGVEAGVILSGVGLLAEARLRNCKQLPEDYPITGENRTFLSFKKPMEILLLSGNVSMAESETLDHAHVTLSHVEGDEIGVLGGHLLEGCTVFGFSEVFMMELEDIARAHASFALSSCIWSEWLSKKIWRIIFNDLVYCYVY